MVDEAAEVDFTDIDALFEWNESRWQTELARMPPVQRAIAAALADTCEEWYTPMHWLMTSGISDQARVPDVRVISRIAAEAVERFSGPTGAGHA